MSEDDSSAARDATNGDHVMFLGMFHTAIEMIQEEEEEEEGEKKAPRQESIHGTKKQ